MELDRVTVALRPRNAWESLDLGFQMARAWFRPIWGVWLAVYLPVAAILITVFDNKFHAVLALMWLKPLFDRAVLHAASRAVFGETIGVASTLRAWRSWLWPGLISGLTLNRLDTARSFSMPVDVLERQKGRAGRKRRTALAARTRGTAVWLWLVCLHVEAVALFASVMVVQMLVPTAAEVVPIDPMDDPMFDAFREFFTWNLQDALHYLFAVSLVEPFYVTAGFALYLNRRTVLEGWDIELQMRRLEERQRGAAPAVLALLACLAVLPLLQALPALAQDAKSPQQEIREVLAAPEFGSEREVKRWRYLGEMADEKSKPPGGISDALRNLILFIADISQGVLWALAIVALVLIVLAVRRFLPAPEPKRAAYRPPDTLFGLDVAPETLPDDIAAAALGAARAGRTREALSLLYRGALSSLIHRYEVELQAGDTEGDCVNAAAAKLPAPSSDYFRELVSSWQGVAYAAQAPLGQGIEALCAGWPRHFSKAGPA